MLMLALVGCVAPVDDVDVSTTEQMICPKFGCGGDNSPLIGGAYFHDLNLDGVANDVGVTYAGFYDKGGKLYSMHVTHGRISAVSGSVTLSGEQLIGSRLAVSFGGVLYAIRIDDVTTVPYWATTTAKLEAYLLTYFPWRYPDRAQQLCSNPQSESPDNLSMTEKLSFYTLLFEGDRIDDTYKKIALDTTGRWFNVACAGGAPAKLALTGHTNVGALDGLYTTILQRQTMLKLITNDACGDGTPFTAPGQPLTWEDAHGYNKLLADATSLEMRWGSNGALCVGTPRTAIPNTPAALAFPLLDSAADLITLCAKKGKSVPACTDTSLNLAGAYLVSANRN
jgi:hypothetical protein